MNCWCASACAALGLASSVYLAASTLLLRQFEVPALSENLTDRPFLGCFLDRVNSDECSASAGSGESVLPLR